MGLVADVHTSGSEVLEEAVGNAAELWVVVPIKGKLQLTRGAIFSYYEFKHPSNHRLTDEAWQAQIGKGAALHARLGAFLHSRPRQKSRPQRRDGR